MKNERLLRPLFSFKKGIRNLSQLPAERRGRLLNALAEGRVFGWGGVTHNESPDVDTVLEYYNISHPVSVGRSERVIVIKPIVLTDSRRKALFFGAA